MEISKFPPPSSDRLKAAFSLDSENGRLFWINPSSYHNEKSGHEAGCRNGNRWIIKIDGKAYRRSQLILCMTEGEWPGINIRHLNGSALDDRPCNLHKSIKRQYSIGETAIDSRYKDKIGMEFGNLKFTGISQKRGDGNRILGDFLCVCGKVFVFAIGRVFSGSKNHCGCLADRGSSRTHGMRNSPEYSSWQAMKARCLDTGNKDYPRWGGKGITVFDGWVDSFAEFYAHIGPRPSGTSIDRIDNCNGYIPGNVRWATSKQQARNTSVFTIIDTPIGRIPLVDYAEKIGLTRGAAHLRMKRGKLEGCSYATAE